MTLDREREEDKEITDFHLDARGKEITNPGRLNVGSVYITQCLMEPNLILYEYFLHHILLAVENCQT